MVNAPETPEQSEAPVMIGCSLQTRPDGTTWVGLNINTLLNSYVQAFPPDVAESIAEQLPSALREAAARARETDGGIVVPASKLIVPGKV